MSTPTVPAARPPAPVAWRWIAAVAGVLLAVLLALSGRYGYHRDELYFIQAGGHLQLGYPDQPLLTPVVAWTMNWLAPRSLLVLRVPAALAGVAAIVSGALIAREIGGGRRAQAIAAASCAVSAVTLATSHFLTTTTLDLAFTSVAWWLLVRLLRSGDERLWVALGAVLGLALLNKLVAGAIVGAAIIALALVGPRELLRSRWVWVGAALAALGVLPYLIWQFAPRPAPAGPRPGGIELGRGGRAHRLHPVPARARGTGARPGVAAGPDRPVPPARLASLPLPRLGVCRPRGRAAGRRRQGVLPRRLLPVAARLRRAAG